MVADNTTQPNDLEPVAHRPSGWADRVGFQTDLAEPIAEICRRLKLDPDTVRSLVLTPRTATAIVYRLNTAGEKYVDPDGEPATDVLEFAICSAPG